MKQIIILLAAIAGANCFSPTVSLSCGTDTTGVSYGISVTNAAVGGVVYIDGACDGQTISSINDTYTFNSTACTSLPALNAEFTVVVQELTSVQQSTDVIEKFVCNTDLSDVNQTETFSVADTIDPCNLTEEQRMAYDLVCTTGSAGQIRSYWMFSALFSIFVAAMT